MTYKNIFIKNILIYGVIYFGIMFLVIIYKELHKTRSLIFNLIGFIVFITICCCIAYLTLTAIKYKEKYYEELKNENRKRN